MEIDYTRRQAGADESPTPPRGIDSPSMSMPIRVSPAARRRHQQQAPMRWSLVLVPALVAVVLGAAGLAWYLIPGAIVNADVGDCASFDRSHPDQPYALVRCGSDQAAFAVLQVLDDGSSCREVPGATRSTIQTDGNSRVEVCMAPVGVDPNQAVNAAQPGDCLTGTAGQEKRVPCTDPTATSRILKRTNHVATTEVSTLCNGVPEATSVFSWTWDTDDGTGPAIASYQTDAVFCLGPIR
jgi:hypothetical protein